MEVDKDYYIYWYQVKTFQVLNTFGMDERQIVLNWLFSIESDREAINPRSGFNFNYEINHNVLSILDCFLTAKSKWSDLAE